MRFTRGESGYESVFLDISHLPIVERYEFRCGYDSGKVFSADQDTELVLQRIAPGNVFTFFYSGMDGRGELRIKPYKEDGILYDRGYIFCLSSRRPSKLGAHLQRKVPGMEGCQN